LNWLKATQDAEEHAGVIVLLERTQELDRRVWLSARKASCLEFVEDVYMPLLQIRDEITLRVDISTQKSLDRKGTLLAAMKPEERGGDAEWEAMIPRAVISLRSAGPEELALLLRELLPNSEDRRKVRLIRTQYRKDVTEAEKTVRRAMGLQDDSWSQPRRVRVWLWL
jgi:hypothetical protein